nr:MAG TPA: hypothetical protein [Caudoviricetes sp.]
MMSNSTTQKIKGTAHETLSPLFIYSVVYLTQS